MSADETAVTTKEGEITSLNTKLSGLKDSQTTAQNNYNSALSTYNSNYSTLLSWPKETITNYSPTGWLQQMIDSATVFYNEYAGEEVKIPAKIYYKYSASTDKITQQKTTTLTISYIPLSETATGWEGPVLEPQFSTFLSTLYKGGVTSINSLFVDLGSQYAEKNNNISTKKAGSNVALGSIAEDAAEAVKGVASDSRYQDNTTTTTDKYQDPDGRAALEKTVKANKAVVDKYYRELNGFKSGDEGFIDGESTEIIGINNQIASVNNQILTLQDEIKTLKNTTIPADNAAVTKAENEYKVEVTDKQDAITKAQNDLNAAKDAVTAAQEKLASAQEALTAAENKANSDALEYYQTVTLTGNVTVSTPITKDYAGTIYGGGNVITLESDTYKNVFTKGFTGKLVNAAINLPKDGKFAASTNGATFEDAASWNGSSGKFYNEKNELTDVNETSTLGSLGYVARNYFGVDFATQKLATLNESTKVFDITIQKLNQEPEQSYVTITDDSNLIGENGASLIIPTNRFAKSATTDIQGRGVANVYFGKNNTCEKVVIDDNGKTDFYCPEEIVATKIEMSRQFTKGYNSVCLPFELNYDLNENIGAICTYEKEAANKFWFIKNGKSVKANIPVLLYANNDFELDLSNITIAATPKVQIVEGTVGIDENPNHSYGIFKTTGRGEFEGEYNADRVYGLTKAGDFKFAGENSTFPAFRMVVCSQLDNQEAPALRAPRLIGIVDEMGIEITDVVTGIKSIDVADASSPNIAGGQGEIIFTSEVDFGKIEIYSLDGMLISVVDVMEGTTTVNVVKGIYLVNGKKVLVK